MINYMCRSKEGSVSESYWNEENIYWFRWSDEYIDGLVQDCSNLIANALE